MATTACSPHVVRGGRVLAAVLAAVLVPLAAGCGSGPAPAAATAPSGSAAASAAAGHAGAASTFCAAAGRFNADQAAIRHQATPGPVLRAARNAIHASAQTRQLAPASLAADVRVVTQTFQPFFTALIADRGVLSKALGTEMRIARSVRGSHFQAAQAALSSYEAGHCGVSGTHRH